MAGLSGEELAGEEDEGRAGDEDGEAGAVVDLVDGFTAGFAGGDGEGERAYGIAAERCGEAEEEKKDPARDGETEKFSDGEGDHDVALQGTDAAARFLDAEEAAGDGDEIAALLGGVAHPMQGFDAQSGVVRHEPAHDGVFLRTRPRHGDKKEEDRKGEVFEPGCAAEQVDQAECHSDAGDGGEGGDHAPVGVGKNHGLQRREKEGGGQEADEGDGAARGGGGSGRRSVGPAAGEKKDGEDGDERAVAVLRVERPFPPVGAEDEEPGEG